MLLQSRLRSYGSFRIAMPCRRASMLLSHRSLPRPQIFPYRSYGPLQRELPVPAHRNPRKHSASGSFFLPPLPPSHAPYGLPATRTHGSAGKVLFPSPSALLSTTGYTAAADRGKNGSYFYNNHRKAFPKWV